MKPDQAKQLLALMIKTYIGNQREFPKKISVAFDSSLIKSSGLTIDEIQKAFNAFVKEKLRGLKGYEESKTQYSEAEKDTFDWVVKLYKLVNKVEVGIYWQYKSKSDNSKGFKDDLVLAITCPSEMSEDERKEFNALYVPYKGEKNPPRVIGKRFLEEPFISSQPVTWECSCRTINWEGGTCRQCGVWRETDIAMKAQIEIPVKN